jgi:hypothetical protein
MGRWLGFAAALPDSSIFLNYALGFWYGSTLVRSGEVNAGDIVIVLFSSMIAFMVRVCVSVFCVCVCVCVCVCWGLRCVCLRVYLADQVSMGVFLRVKHLVCITCARCSPLRAPASVCSTCQSLWPPAPRQPKSLTSAIARVRSTRCPRRARSPKACAARWSCAPSSSTTRPNLMSRCACL